MTTDQQITGLQLRSLVKKSGEIELSLARQPVPEPAADQLVVRVEAAPINPSDLALLVGPADLSTLKISGTREQPVVTAAIPPNLMRGLAARVDQSLPVGNEGAGVVIKAGSSPEAKRLVGKAVAMLGGATRPNMTPAASSSAAG
jgi:NADPH:quinone reductase-like Zn-dependent oxidoreductase